MVSMTEKYADPLALVIAGVVMVAGSFDVFSRIGLDADDVAQLQAGLLAVAAAVRMFMKGNQ